MPKGQQLKRMYSNVSGRCITCGFDFGKVESDRVLEMKKRLHLKIAHNNNSIYETTIETTIENELLLGKKVFDKDKYLK